jgi:hypothetical protein
MKIRIRSTGQVVYEEAFRQYIQQNNGPSWGQTTAEILNQLNADVVFDSPYPDFTRYQVAIEGPAVEQNGQWYTSYVIADVNADARTAIDNAEATSVRQARNDKLTKCDWTQTSDCPLTNKTEWATYRQALRDLTKQNGFPWSITWPDEPKG